MTKTDSKNRLTLFILLALIILTFLVSFFSLALKKGKFRAIFYYESFDSEKLCTETRWLPKDSVQSREHLFVDELLLGPLTNRYKYVFAPGTRVDFFDVKDDTVYVGLSREALKNSRETADINEGISLLKKNIVKNFTKINTVLVYIDGKCVERNSWL